MNLIDEKIVATVCHGQLYQSRVVRAFDKNVRPREFQLGDLVLKKILPNQSDPRVKWSPSYVVKKAFSGSALILTYMDGEELQRLVKADAKEILCL